MARFALFTNGVKVETLDELRENYNISDMLQNFESKALHRWLAVNHYQKELPLIENISSEDVNTSLMDVLGLSGQQKDNAIHREKQRVLAIENKLKLETEQINAQQIQEFLFQKSHISLDTLTCQIINVEKVLHGGDFIAGDKFYICCETDKKFYYLNNENIFEHHDSLNNLENADRININISWNKFKSKNFSNGSIVTFEDKSFLQYDEVDKWSIQECFWLKNKNTFFNFDHIYEIVPSADQNLISLSKEDGKCTLCFLDASGKNWSLQSRTCFEDKSFVIDEMVFFKGVYIAATSKTGPCGNGKINTFHSIYTSNDACNFSCTPWSQEAPHTFWTKHLFSLEDICFVTVSDCITHYTLDGETWLPLDYKFEKIFKYKEVYFADIPLGNQKQVFTSDDGVQWKKLINLENIEFRGICNDTMFFHDYYPQDRMLIVKLDW